MASGVILFTFFSSMFFSLLALYSYRYRRNPGGIPFVLAMLLLAFLGIATAGEQLAADFHQKIKWRNFQQIPFFLFPVLIYILLLQFTGKGKEVIIRRSLLLSFPICVYLVLVFTDEWHHLMREKVTLIPYGDFEQTVVEPTDLSILFILYARLIVAATLFLLFQSIRKVSKLNRKQYYMLILATLIPYISTFIPDTFGLKVNTAIASIPTGLLYFYALFKYKLLHVHPVATDKIIQNINEGIVVVDQHGIIVQLNPLSELILHQVNSSDTDFIGESLPSVLQPHTELLCFYKERRNHEKEFIIDNHHYKVASVPVDFTKYNRGFLLIFTDITERKKYEESLLRKATIDSLTQVYNRQYLIEAAEEEIREITNSGQSLSFILLDIDKFKAINDTYGHPFGDHILEIFAEKLREIIAHSGIVSRVGGEEFAVLLADMGAEEAYELGEEIRQEIENIKLWNKDLNKPFTFTVSLGVTCVSVSAITFKELFNQADRALYEAKENGRNRTVIRTLEQRKSHKIG